MSNKNKKRRSAIPEVPAAKSVAHQAKKQDSAGGGWFTFKNIRESVESLAIACILAFLFRTFEAEAFTIPTGSMAVTLMGEHKDLPCPKCGHWFRAGDSAESRVSPVSRLTCPMCRNPFPIDPQHKSADRSYSGDHILISKFAYLLDDPHRWDVAVFRYPGNAKMNYIKRIVGLPNEQLRIQGGNIYTRPAAEPQAKFQIARKPAFRAKAMLQLVDDDRFVPEQLAAAGWPSRWQAEPGSAWKIEEQAPENGNVRRVYRSSGDAASNGSKESWLRYRHFTPTENDWKLIEAKKPIPDLAARSPRLIDDFNGYNAVGRPNVKLSALGIHWVGDLAMEARCSFDVSNVAPLLLDLVEGGRHYTCEFDTGTGKAKLMIDGGFAGFVDEAQQPAAAHPTADTPIRISETSSREFNVRFANVDDQLLLWVNDREIEFDRPTTYVSPADVKPATSDSDPGDLAPVGIGSKGAVTVKNLRVLRDIYYIAVQVGDIDSGVICDYKIPDFLAGDQGLWDQSRVLGIGPGTPQASEEDRRRAIESQFTLPTNFQMANEIVRGIRQVLGDPALWTKSKLFESRRTVEFEQGDEQYFPLGDNSAESLDARIWEQRVPNVGYRPLAHWIPRESIKGKALIVYWPHPWRSPIPLIPNFARMGFIR